MTDEEKINEAREIFKASRQAHIDAINAKLEEVVEMVQGNEAVDNFWLGSPPVELQSMVNTIRMYRPAPIPPAFYPVVPPSNV